MKSLYLALAVCATVTFLGCTAAEFDHIDRPLPASPCVPSNQYYCGPKAGCCDDSYPECRTDPDGPYCAVDESNNTQDNTVPGSFAAKPKRAPRIPESK